MVKKIIAKVTALCALCALITLCCSCRADYDAQAPEWAKVTEGTYPPAPFESPTETENAVKVDDGKLNEYDVTIAIEPETRTVNVKETVVYRNRTGVTLGEIAFVSYFSAFTENFVNGANAPPYFDERLGTIFPSGEAEYAKLTFTDICVYGETAEFTSDGLNVAVKLSEPLAPLDDVTVTLTFEAYIPIMNHRTGANEFALWFGNFLPLAAYFDKGEGNWRKGEYYPVGDPFAPDFANFSVAVTTPRGFMVVGTGEADFHENERERVTAFKARSVREFAFAVSSAYQCYTIKTDAGKYINLYYYSEEPKIEELAAAAKRAADWFCKNVGDYRDSVFDIAETGLYLVGGEDYPLIAFMDTGYFFKGPPYAEVFGVMGKQWFGTAVGSDSVREPWLTGGLVSFLQLDALYSDKQAEEVILSDYDLLKSFYEEHGELAASGDLSEYSSLRDFTLIQNTRPSLMLYSLRNKMGKERFGEFIKAYFARFSYKIASGADFISTAEEFYGESLKEFFDKWLYGAGLPELTTAGSLELTTEEAE